jgi:hypothetical protein
MFGLRRLLTAAAYLKAARIRGTVPLLPEVKTKKYKKTG